MRNARNGGQTNPNAFFDDSQICLFELNDAGTILYCRNNQQSNYNFAEFVGSNLFDEAAPFENVEELRRRLNRFVKGDDATQKFTFDCRIENKIIPTKIMLVRVENRSDGEPDKTTLIDIRKI